MPASASHLAANGSSHAWAYRPTTAFGELTSGVAILPVHGFADHGLGLPLDIEEVIGSELLRKSTSSGELDHVPVIFPPVRWGLSPYQSGLAALDPETLLSMLNELSLGIKQAGYRKLVFWNTSPWNAEIIDVASRDIRINLGLQTFVVDIAGLGLSLHPRSQDRADVQSIGAYLTGTTPGSITVGEPVDTKFRPGNWSVLPPVAGISSVESEARLDTAALRLTGLWQEIFDRPGLDTGGQTESPSESSTLPEADCPYPAGRRQNYLPGLTATALHDLPDKGKKLVIIPVGAIEQHGAHLPVGVDSMIAEAASAEISRRLPNQVWFAPTITYGKSNEHADYPGTVGLSANTLRRTVKALVQQLHAEGFRQFALLNTHGGNSSVLVYTLRELQVELQVRAGMLRIPTTDELSPQERTWGFHAGEWETSIMLAIAPETVRMQEAICHYPAQLDDPGELRPENAPAVFSWQTRDIAPGGVMGDATLATAAKGERWLQAAMDELADQIRTLPQWDA